MSAALKQEANKRTVTEYLGSLVWDGTARIDQWLVDYANAEDSSYVRAASRAMLVAAVRRARHPGGRFDAAAADDVDDVDDVDDADDADDVDDVDDADNADVDVDVDDDADAGVDVDVDADDDDADDDADADADDDDDDADDTDTDTDDDDAEDTVLPPAAAAEAFLSWSVDDAYMPSRMPRQFVVAAEVRDQLWAEAAHAEAAGEPIDLAVSIPTHGEKAKFNMTEKKTQRYSISVSSRTYDRLRTEVPGSLAAFVDDIVVAALDDPEILSRVVAKCHPRKEADAWQP